RKPKGACRSPRRGLAGSRTAAWPHPALLRAHYTRDTKETLARLRRCYWSCSPVTTRENACTITIVDDRSEIMNTREVSRRAVLVGGSAALAALAFLRLPEVARAFPTRPDE